MVPALGYLSLGWSPIPLPARKKYPPPDGLTGWKGRYLTETEVDAFDWTGNIALRLSPDVVGVDLDLYAGGKTGMAELKAKYGSLPPSPMISTSREDGSGIALYAVPVGTTLQGAPAVGVQIIQWFHRYATCWPSIHPEGRPYRWFDSVSGELYDELGRLPFPGELPLLPQSWTEGLAAIKGAGAKAATPEVAGCFADQHTTGDWWSGLDAALRSLEGVTKGGRHDALIDRACWLAREVAADRYPFQDAFGRLEAWWAVAVADEPKRLDDWEFDSAVLWAIGQALAEPERIEGMRREASGNGRDESKTSVPLLVRASRVKAVRLRWLWAGRIPLGTGGLLIGYEGLGKSMLTVDITACLTRGTLPGEFLGTPVDVVYVTAEDSYSSTVVPRLMAAGADLDRVHFVPMDASLSLPRDLVRLSAEMRAVGARLLVLDPFTVHIGSEQMDSHKDRDVRSALAPVVAAMDELGATCVGIVHWNKSQGSNPLDRIGGARGWSAASRFHLGVANDPQDPTQTQRILISSKANLAPGGSPALTFTIVEEWVELGDGEGVTSVGKIVWTGERTGIRPEDLFAPAASDVDTSELDRAREFVRDVLDSGPVESKTLSAGARAAGIAPRTLDRARAAEGVKARRLTDAKGRLSGWIVDLPTRPPSPDGGLDDGGLVGSGLTRENMVENRSSTPSHMGGVLDVETAPRARSVCPSCAEPLTAVFGPEGLCRDCFKGRSE
jgi:hypothetical protein